MPKRSETSEGRDEMQKIVDEGLANLAGPGPNTSSSEPSSEAGLSSNFESRGDAGNDPASRGERGTLDGSTGGTGSGNLERGTTIPMGSGGSDGKAKGFGPEGGTGPLPRIGRR